MRKLSAVHSVGDVSNGPGTAGATAGWYAEDADHRRVLGPFASEEECLKAIAEHPEAAEAENVSGAIGASG